MPIDSTSVGSATAIFNKAIADHQAGRLEEARSGYQAVLKTSPKHFDARHLIGVIALQSGELEDARKLISDAISLNPNSAPAWNNLGNVYLKQLDLDEALKCFRRAIRLQPEYADAHLNAGNVLRRKKRLDEAVSHFRRATSLNIRSPQAHLELGSALLDLGDPAAAARSFEVVLKLDAGRADAHANYAAALLGLGDLEKALDTAERALALSETSTTALNVRGTVLFRLGRYEEARESLERIVEMQPASAIANSNLGALLLEAGDAGRAVVFLRRAIELDPNLVQAQINLAQALGNSGEEDDAQEQIQRTILANRESVTSLLFEGSVCLERGDNSAAETAYRRAVKLQPQNCDASYHLGTVLMFRGDMVEARACFQRALALNPNHLRARWAEVMALVPPVAADANEVTQSREKFAHALNGLDQWFDSQRSEAGHEAVGSTQPFYLSYQSRDNRELLSRYGSLCTRLMEPWSAHNVRRKTSIRSRDGPLRLGIASTHFFDHSIWNAIVKGWMKNLDRNQIEIHLFNLGKDDDDETSKARIWSDHVEDGRRGLVEWCRCIAESDLDVLLYPAIGMDILTVKLASQRLAPLQMTTWGHPETSGLPTIDYFISSDCFESQDAQSNYTERLIKLPNLGVWYEASLVAPVRPDLKELGLPENVPLLLCPGTPFKFSPEYDNVWTEVARKVGPCHLIFFHPRDARLSSLLTARLKKAFKAAGLAFDQYVTFLPYLDRARYYGLMTLSRLFLDSPGFSGFNTVIQAVECGLPVITYETPFLRGRLGSGLLRKMGLEELIASSEADYVRLVVELVNNDQRGRQIRDRMIAQRKMLFEDVKPIRALESFLLETAKRESAPPTGKGRGDSWLERFRRRPT